MRLEPSIERFVHSIFEDDVVNATVWPPQEGLPVRFAFLPCAIIFRSVGKYLDPMLRVQVACHSQLIVPAYFRAQSSLQEKATAYTHPTVLAFFPLAFVAGVILSPYFSAHAVS